MAKIVIIGAGLTGLSTAYHLEKKGFFDYKLFEKETDIGGLCRSVVQDGFTFDFTGHLLHISDPYFKSLIATIVGIDTFNAIVRRSFIYSHGVHTPYPFQINLHGLPETVIADCIEGFVTRDKSRKKPRTYYQWVQKTFGAGFGKHFFFPYQTKIFAYDLRKISHLWTGRFVPSTSLNKIIRGAISNKTEEKVGYNATFLYPKQGGIHSWVKTFAQHIINPVFTNFTVESVDTITKVVHFTNGHSEPFDQLISTMPLDFLVRSMKERSSTDFHKAGPHLICNSVVNFNLGIARKNFSDKHWIYYPEKQFPFYRLGFPSTFASSMAPQGCSSLYGEFAYINKSNSFVQRMTRNALDQTKKLLKLTDNDIVTTKIISIPRAYVIYNFWREKNLTALHKGLNEQAIYSIGRYGEWKYSSMQEAILDGKKEAERIITTPKKELFFVPQPQQKHNKKNISLS